MSFDAIFLTTITNTKRLNNVRSFTKLIIFFLQQISLKISLIKLFGHLNQFD